MNKFVRIALLFAFCHSMAWGQSMHFSQFYNAPLLINPANAALSPEYDYRVGVNYRNQWATLPVPYSTTDVFGDIKIGANRNVDHPNWLGLGIALFNDQAGSGNLSLMQYQGALAYHIHIGPSSMLSFGGSAAYIQRSVDYDKLSFDVQWDGHKFDGNLPNKEQIGIMKTNYSTVNLGANFAIFPSNALYMKVGVGVANVNQPVETFYSSTNQIGLRPTLNVDVLVKPNFSVIVNPSLFAEMQKGALEVVAGSLSYFDLTGSKRASDVSQLILGVFYRWNDAVIGTAGYQYNGLRIMASYDATVSALAPYNTSYGALEFSLIYGSPFGKNKGTTMYACPRF